MAGPLTKYAFINAKVRARISKLLSEDILRQMVTVRSIDDALVLLRDSPFGILDEIYTKSGDLKLAELELLKNEIEVYGTITRYVRDEILDFVRSLLLRFEIDNLKNALRIFFDGKIRKRDVEDAVHYILYDKIINTLNIDAITNAENLGEIAQSLAATPYGAIIEKQRATVEQESSLFRLEVTLDHFFYTNLIHQAKGLRGTDRREALRLIGVEIDLQNINWIIRFKNFYNLPLEQVLSLVIPSGFNLDSASIGETYSSQNVSSILNDVLKKKYPGLSTMLTAQTSDSSSRLLLIERILEQVMKHEIQRILQGYPFTIGIILCYFLLKKNEIARVKTVLNAKHYGVSEERIEGML